MTVGGSKVPVRLYLFLLSFTGFMVNFMLRTDFNIAIIKMAKQDNDSNIIGNHNELLNEPEFNWTIKEQSNLHSAFYWWYFVSSGLSGLYINRWSSKHVFGFGHLISALGTLITPIIASNNYLPILIVKSIQGIAGGATWPAFFVLISRWIPPFERNRFVSATFGIFIGIGITYSGLGYVIEYFTWRACFYLTGSLSLIWCAFWFWNVSDYPKDHPTITEQELKFIESNVTVDHAALEVPWRSIVTSPIVWSIAAANFGRMWVITMLFTNGPLFLKNVLRAHITKNGVHNGVPYIIAYIIGTPMSFIADHLIYNNILSTIQVRRIYSAITLLGCNATIFGMLYVQSAWIFSALICICLCATMANGSASMASIVDISPNFSGPVFAFCSMIFMSACYICPIVTAAVVKNASNVKQWEILFEITLIIISISNTPYILIVKDDVQSWNYSVMKNEKNKSDIEKNLTGIENKQFLIEQ